MRMKDQELKNATVKVQQHYETKVRLVKLKKSNQVEYHMEFTVFSDFCSNQQFI